MSWIIPRYRDLWRFRAPLSAGEVRRTERWLATARVALTISAVVTLLLEPVRGFAYSRWLYWLLTVYLVHAVVVMLLLRFRPQSTTAFRLVVHVVDILWPVFISLFATSQRGPFFLFFVFVMAAAAYRWGLWETVGTACLAVILLWTEAFAVRAGLEAAADRWLHLAHLPRLGVSLRELDPQQLFMSSVYLIVLGFLLGYMSENQKKVRAERAVITRVLSSTRIEAGLTGTMQQILGEVMSIYGARRVLGASQEVNSYRVFLSEVKRGAEGVEALRWREALPESEKAYLFNSPADAILCVAQHRGLPHRVAESRTASACATPARNFWMRWCVRKNFDVVVSVALTVRGRVDGPRVPVRSRNDRGTGRGVAVPAGVRAAGGSRDLQRLSDAAFARTRGRGRAGALRTRASRWRNSIADRA